MVREIILNRYIDDEESFSDEITPVMLHNMLYEHGSNQYDNVHIKLNDYDENCNYSMRIRFEHSPFL